MLSLALMFFEKGRWVLAKIFWAAESFLLPLTSIGRWEPLQALDAVRYQSFHLLASGTPSKGAFA